MNITHTIYVIVRYLLHSLLMPCSLAKHNETPRRLWTDVGDHSHIDLLSSWESYLWEETQSLERIYLTRFRHHQSSPNGLAKFRFKISVLVCKILSNIFSIVHIFIGLDDLWIRMDWPRTNCVPCYCRSTE